MRHKFLKGVPILIGLFTFTLCCKGYTGSASWAQSNSGNWSDASKWTAGGPPNGAGEVATFGSYWGFSPETISIDSGFATVGSIIMDNQNATNLQQTTGSLTLANSGSDVTIAALEQDNLIGVKVLSISAPITLSDNLQVNRPINGNWIEVSGAISGNHNVTISNLGTNQQNGIVFSGSNSYTGTTTVTDGPFKLKGNGSIDSSSAVSINAGCTISLVGSAHSGPPSLTFNNLTGSGTLDIAFPSSNNKTVIIPSGNFSGVITGSIGKIEKTTAGVLILTGANSYSGGTTVSGGTLQGNTTSLQGAITNNSTVTFDQAASGTYAGVMSGSGTLFKEGAGTLTLSGANTYTGGTTVSVGTLEGSATSLQGAITNNTTVIFDQATDGTYAGAMSGSGALIKNGSGKLTLSGANTYSGGTNVSGGTLQGNTSSLQGAITNNGTVIFDQAASGTYAGVMSGSGTLVKEGAGTLTLSGAHTYSGGTTVSVGTLQGNTTSLQGPITNNATVSFDQAASGTYAGVMSGSGTLIKEGAGTLTLSGANTYTGGTTVSVGTLEGSATSLQGAITNNTTVIFDQATDGTYAGAMSGSGALIKNGVGTLTLSGANTYTGGTNVPGGTLQGNTTSLQGAITNNGTVIFDQAASGTYAGVMSGSGTLVKEGAGTLTLSGAHTYSGGTTVSTGILEGNTTSLQGPITNNATVTFDQGANGTYAGVMSGSGTLVKEGAGTLTLSGTNTYTGGTTVSTGILQGNTTSLQGAITNNATVTFDQGANGTYGDIISGSGILIKEGAGTLTLSGANTYTGGTTVSAGTLQGNTTSLQGPITNNATVSFDQATDGTYAGVIGGSGSLIKEGVGTLTLSGAHTYSGGTTVSTGILEGNTTSLQGPITNNATVSFDQAASGTYAGVMSGSGSLIKEGAGTLTLSGTNTYTGGTTVSAGILQGSTTSLQGPITNNTTVIFDQVIDGTFAGAISGTGNLVKNGTGTAILSQANTYIGGTTVSGGTLQGSTSSLQGPITNNATVSFDQATDGTYAGVMGGSGSLIKEGAGTLTLSGTHTYSGGTTVSGGTLKGNTTSLQGPITNNATVSFDQAASGTYAGVMSGSGSLIKEGVGTLTLSGAHTYSGGTTVSGGILQGNTTSLQGPITNNSVVMFDQAVNDTYAGTMNGLGTLIKQGAGTLTLSGANTYTGGTTVSAGTLQGSAISLQGPITNNTIVIFDQGVNGTYAGVMSGSGTLIKEGAGTLKLSGANTYTGGTTVSAGILEGSATSLQGLITNNATVVFDQETDETYESIMSGTGNLVKNGTGTTILSQLNTYSGTTTVNGGILDIVGQIGGISTEVNMDGILKLSSGTITSTDTTINGGGLLTGNGTIGKLTNSGTVSPGDSIGTININGGFVQTSSGDLQIEITEDGTSDLINIIGVASLDGTLTLEPEPGLYPDRVKYTFMNYASRTGTLTLIEDSELQFSIKYRETFAELVNATGGPVLPIKRDKLRGIARRVANYLFCPGVLPINHDLITVIKALLKGPPGQFRSSLAKLSPAQFGALPLVNTQNSRLVADLLVQSTEKYNWCDSCQTETNPQTNKRKTSVWVAPVGHYYNQEGIQNQVGFDSYAVGVGIGANHFFSNCVLFGGGVGYTYSEIDWDKNRGDGHIHSVYVGPSLGLVFEKLYINFLALGSYNHYDINRKIQFPGINRTASNTHHSYDILGRIDGGYKFRINTGGTQNKPYFIIPEVSVSYLNVFEEGYNESGADSINLSVDSKYSAFLQPNVLIKLLREVCTPS